MNWIFVFIGGGLGSLARFGMSKALPYKQGFPWATFWSNLLACVVLPWCCTLVRKLPKQIGFIPFYLLGSVVDLVRSAPFHLRISNCYPMDITVYSHSMCLCQ